MFGPVLTLWLPHCYFCPTGWLVSSESAAFPTAAERLDHTNFISVKFVAYWRQSRNLGNSLTGIEVQLDWSITGKVLPRFGQ